MCVIAVAGCGEVFPSVDSGAPTCGVFYACKPEILRPGWPAFIAGNSPANGGNMRVSVALRPTD